jgi:hypothetical protein
MRSRKLPNASPLSISKVRGRGSATSSRSTIRPGRADITTTSSASNRISQTTDFFLAHGVPDPAAARHQAIVALGNAVKRQALVMGFSDTFAVIAAVLVFAAIAVAFTRRVRGGGAAH